MQTFLTPEPVVLELRNAAGEIHVDLTDTTVTTVDVTFTGSRRGGFDDMLGELFRSWNGRRGGSWSPFADGPGASDTAEGGTTTAEHAGPDPVDQVRVEHRPSDDGPDVLVVDTDPAREGRRGAFVVRVTAPLDSGVRIRSQSAPVTVTGPADRVEVRSASGDVRLAHTRGRTVAQTASGDVSLESSTGDVDLRSASGDVRVGRVEGAAVLHSTSGSVRIDEAGGDVSVRNVSGDVRVGDAVAGKAEIHAVSGDVEIGVHAGSVARLDLRTVSGRTDTDFEVRDEQPAADAPQLDIRVKTTSGDIRLRRAA
ncbi:DUF4097 family beta strand repeat protein [Nakamurella sp. YIM 132087]|uniref:DUF4097 family beta strand repeat protein n=1 Tax=Nakamurella alba TaxID=2665158 RepID=A0A7K1FHY0_9ACTN|nr:DUF4097 family beta strand repeat-containing protein [Nakamurella alba]MTD13735.1 DUF4097 family beta strand repeat protein [Nakamurella alba]